MADVKTLAGYINHCTDTAANWAAENPIVPVGVLCLEVNANNSIRLKRGDGITPWNSLPYKFDHSIGYATETIAGLVLKASNAEALNGLDDLKYLTPATLQHVLDNINLSSQGIILQPGTIPYKQILSLITRNNTSYPTGLVYGNSEPLNFVNSNNDIIFRMEHKGSATLSITYRRIGSSGTVYLRVLKNNSQVASWQTTSITNLTQTVNVSFVPGDIIQIQGRTSTSSIQHEISACALLIQDLNL